MVCEPWSYCKGYKHRQKHCDRDIKSYRVHVKAHHSSNEKHGNKAYDDSQSCYDEGGGRISATALHIFIPSVNPKTTGTVNTTTIASLQPIPKVRSATIIITTAISANISSSTFSFAVNP